MTHAAVDHGVIGRVNGIVLCAPSAFILAWPSNLRSVIPFVIDGSNIRVDGIALLILQVGGPANGGAPASGQGTIVIEYLQRARDGAGERIGVFSATEVETVNLAIVAPLVESGRRLAVLETFQDCAVDDHLVILKLAAHDAECVIQSVLVDVDFGEATG